MDKLKLNLVFQSGLVLLMALALVNTLPWPYATALLPRTAGGIVLILLLVLICRDLVALRAVRADPEVRKPKSHTWFDDVRPPASELLWLVFFGAAIWALGFYLATFLYLSGFLWRRTDIGILKALLWAVSVTIGAYLLFDLLLKVHPYSGHLAWLLN